MGLKYYKKITTTTEYVEYSFGGAAKNVNFVAAHANSEDVEFSWDSENLDGEIESGDTFHMPDIGRSSVWVKSSSGNQEIKVWAWKSDWAI